MHIVKKIDGVWTALSGVVDLEKMVTSATLTRGNGTQETVEVKPYPVTNRLDIGVVSSLVRDGVWTDADLAPYGLKAAVPFVAPAGKRATGQVSFTEKKGVVSEVYEVEDIPPPPPPPTPEQKLARAGLSDDDFDALLAKSEARRAKKAAK